MADKRDDAFYTWMVAIPPGHEDDPGVAASSIARDMKTALADLGEALRRAPWTAVGAIIRTPKGSPIPHSEAANVVAVANYDKTTDTVEVIEPEPRFNPDGHDAA